MCYRGVRFLCTGKLSCGRRNPYHTNHTRAHTKNNTQKRLTNHTVKQFSHLRYESQSLSDCRLRSITHPVRWWKKGNRYHDLQVVPSVVSSVSSFADLIAPPSIASTGCMCQQMENHFSPPPPPLRASPPLHPRNCARWLVARYFTTFDVKLAKHLQTSTTLRLLRTWYGWRFVTHGQAAQFPHKRNC